MSQDAGPTPTNEPGAHNGSVAPATSSTMTEGSSVPFWTILGGLAWLMREEADAGVLAFLSTALCSLSVIRLFELTMDAWRDRRIQRARLAEAARRYRDIHG